MQALRRMQHVVVGAGRALIVLIIFPRRVELRELRIEFVVGGGRAAAAAAPLAVLKGSDGAPSNGELMIVTERKMSGRMSAAQDATGAPASCPTTIATERWPSA